MMMLQRFASRWARRWRSSRCRRIVRLVHLGIVSWRRRLAMMMENHSAVQRSIAVGVLEPLMVHSHVMMRHCVRLIMWKCALVIQRVIISTIQRFDGKCIAKFIPKLSICSSNPLHRRRLHVWQQFNVTLGVEKHVGIFDDDQLLWATA